MHIKSGPSRTGRGKLRAGGGERPSPETGSSPGAGWGVPLTRLVFALSAAFEPAAPSAAVGVGGMKNAVVKMEESNSADGSNSRREPTCGEGRDCGWKHTLPSGNQETQIWGVGVGGVKCSVGMTQVSGGETQTRRGVFEIKYGVGWSV